MATGVVPQSGLVTYRGDISGVVNEFVTDESRLIGKQICPLVPSSSDSDYFYVFEKGVLTKRPDPTRAPSTGYKRDSVELGQDTYIVQSFGLEALIPREHQAKYRDKFDLKAERARHKAMEISRWHEKLVLDLIEDTTKYPDDDVKGRAVDTPWADLTNGTPITDISILLDGLDSRSGGDEGIALVVPNRKTYRNLCMGKQVRESLGLRYSDKANTMATVPVPVLADCLSVDTVLINREKYNSTPDSATPTMLPLANPDKAQLVRIPKQASINEYCLGKTIYWDAMGGFIEVWEYEEPRQNSDVIQVNAYFVVKEQSQDHVGLFTNID